jgi:competence protein ComEA
LFDLTPTERRGALVLLALVALGACADLWQMEPARTPEPVDAPAPMQAGSPASPPPASAAAPLDLNAASEAELDGLPGIGPVLASRIVAHRGAQGPFHGVEDLLAVPGIGPRLFARLRPLVTVRGPSPGAAPEVQFARRSPK